MSDVVNMLQWLRKRNCGARGDQARGLSGQRALAFLPVLMRPRIGCSTGCGWKASSCLRLNPAIDGAALFYRRGRRRLYP
jgi:hypothetical protein